MTKACRCIDRGLYQYIGNKNLLFAA